MTLTNDIERILQEQDRAGKLNGPRLGAEEARDLRARLPVVPDWFIDLATRYGLLATEVAVTKDQDESKRGVELRFLTADQLLSEALEAYPGVLATQGGLCAFGMCMKGSGDSYFLDTTRPGAPVVRIPHDAVVGDALDRSMFEQVSPSFGALLERARFKGKLF